MNRSTPFVGMFLVCAVSWIHAEDAPVPAPACNCKPMAVTVTRATGRAADAVGIQNFTYMSANLTINVGDTVTWTNSDSAPHTATSDKPLFDTGTLTTGMSGSFTFNTAGTFPYHCTIHPFMTATVTVLGAPAAPVLTNLTANATVGANFKYTITATGTQPITFGATVPAGLQLNGAVITGTFNAAGPVSIPLTATNSVGSDAKNLVVTVAAASGASNLTGTWSGRLKSKFFSQIGTSPKAASESVTLTLVQTDATLTATFTIQGGSAEDLGGRAGNGNLWLIGGDGVTSYTLSGQADKKGATISGTGIIYDINGDQEVTFKLKKQ